MQTEKMITRISVDKAPNLTWASLYQEAELYKAAVRVYTKPLFAWRKSLSTSTDGKNLYDFARYGLRNLECLHRALIRREFHYRPGLAVHQNFNGKKRTLYLYPWEERIVDLLLYRMLSRRLDAQLSSRSFAYRLRGFGVDSCQRQIARTLGSAEGAVYVLKRDIANYFPSVDHEILWEQLTNRIAPHDYLWQLLGERIAFEYRDGDLLFTATQGIPFGTSIACLLANLHLTELDRTLSAIPGIHYFRYADDFLLLSADRDAALEAAEKFNGGLAGLKLTSKPSHEQNLVYSAWRIADHKFVPVSKFRHLGLEFRASGPTGLSRDKFRKICNVFRFGFRRSRMKLNRIKDSQKKARAAIEIAQKTMDRGVRNVAILDYYLKHVEDEEQLQRLDRWLAEEVLAIVFGGHRRGHFRRISYRQLRAMGLPALVHRRRLLRHGRLASPFFIWKGYQEAKGSRGTAARPPAGLPGPMAFSPHPEAAAEKAL